jgi:hypothetical protein
MDAESIGLAKNELGTATHIILSPFPLTVKAVGWPDFNASPEET